MKIDLADVGPGVAWVFEFDEDGRGRPKNDKRSIDLMHGRRFVWAHLILANARTRDWVVGEPFGSVVGAFTPAKLAIPRADSPAVRAGKQIAQATGAQGSFLFRVGNLVSTH